MRGIANQLKAVIIVIHRWMGLAFCLLFLSWFCSGVAMMYTDYPSVSRADRLAHLSPLNASTIDLTPSEAFARLHIEDSPERVTLRMLDGRPAYKFYSGDDGSIVYADDGQIQEGFPADFTLRIASAWAGQPADTATVRENAGVDQWTVPGEFRALRPIRKYTWPNGREVYVSTVTGEVVQYTTRRSRIAAYLGPIPHWLYFTPLRTNGARWSRIVIWTAALSTGVALLGLIIGIWTYSPTKRFRYGGAPSVIPYTGSKRWHMALGLLFGPLACTWAFSGMLSMDPFPRLQTGGSERTAARLANALRDNLGALSEFDSKPPSNALLQLAPDFQAKDMELTSFAGEPFYLVSASENQSMVVPIRGEPSLEFSREKIIDIVGRTAMPTTITQARTVTEYESYYLDRRHRLPLPVIFVQLNDEERSMYYIDPKTADIVEAYDSLSRRNRWLYHGLHSMNFPWLYQYRPLWDAVVLTLLGGCIVLSFTSIILAWRVIRGKFSS
jgi:PepSY-associated TM region